ncbi:DinB family protein [Paenibacillus sp.]|uniref:DinB family protein n=1 Tax=Paenibacillus sp. TaxID=58172 RepID=UPI002D557697|nr:DinB family protein [Paenibacillus sp.]HZG87954.1 DinB family protein [Paenibacillus sp.]
MYRTIQEFLTDWSREERFTLQVLETLTDDSLSQAVSDKQPRTLGDLGWHLAGSIGAFLGASGVTLEGPDYRQPTPTRAADIAEAYRQLSASAAKALKEQWSDEKLAEKLQLFGFIDTTYAGVLTTLVRHQIHHRGQMTILMRQAGLVAPGIYGPNEEETAAIQASRG